MTGSKERDNQMAEYHKMMHMDEVEPDALDEYLSINEEDRINELDIIHLFGKEKLETIQESLSKATGLAFITVDFKGDPITSATSFSRYCEKGPEQSGGNGTVQIIRCVRIHPGSGYTENKRILLPMRTFGGCDTNYRARSLSGRVYRRSDPM